MTTIDNPALPDMFTPSSTDSGAVPNLRFSFSDAHNRRTEPAH